jgi:hypothetical protein
MRMTREFERHRGREREKRTKEIDERKTSGNAIRPCDIPILSTIFIEIRNRLRHVHYGK